MIFFFLQKFPRLTQNEKSQKERCNFREYLVHVYLPLRAPRLPTQQGFFLKKDARVTRLMFQHNKVFRLLWGKWEDLAKNNIQEQPSKHFFVGNNRCLRKEGKNLTERPLLLFADSSQDSKTDSQQTPKSCAHTREEEERKKWVREIIVSSRRPSFRGKIHALTYFFSEQTQGKRERKKEIGMCGLNRRKEGKSEYVTCQCHLSLLGFDADFISILLPGFGCLKARPPSSHFPNLKEGRKMTPHPTWPKKRGRISLQWSRNPFSLALALFWSQAIKVR